MFTELQSDRLRAGLDVVAQGDRLAQDHPARNWPNVLFTVHDLCFSTWNLTGLECYEVVCLDNLRRF